MNPAKTLFLLASFVQAPQAAEAPASMAAPPEEIAPGVHLLRGAFVADRGPDGNTVIFEAPEGFVVVDTGRHRWHSDAILSFASGQDRPIAAIVNTHWHLDHSSGNGRLKGAHPQARVHTSRAVDRALAADGFLVRNLESAKSMLDDPKLGETRRDEVRIFIATMDERDILRPDVAVEASGERELGGRAFDLGIATRAVTDADVWLYDAGSGVAAIGDLVTLPAPFFETACPAGWRKALDDVRDLPFRVAVPGHGEPLSRAQFDAYREAFGKFVDCASSDAAAQSCAAAWRDGVAPLLGSDPKEAEAATRYAEYYVGFLREGGGRSRDCLDR
jgi:glyoxylase-like metal-dependent hydrolase (beta-lactamase superfamily II)